MKKKRDQKKAEHMNALDNRMKTFMALVSKMEPLFQVCFVYLVVVLL